ncbi:MAG: hypothetical protein ACRETF_06485 [Nevskiaceae bacterium]
MSKRLLIVGGAIVVVLGIAAAVVLGRLGRLIESAVETQGPRMTGTEVSLGSARVSVFSGQGSLNDLRIGNPEGYSDGEAFDLGKIAIVVDPKSLASDVVRIRSVVIDGPRLLAEFNAAGRTNLKAILDRVKSVARAGGSTSTGSSPGGQETKLIIEEFRFENAEARALAPAFNLDKTLKIPPVVLKNLGAKQGGAAAADLANQILRPIVDSTVQAATREYVKAQRGKLEDKAKGKLTDLLKK